MKDTIRKTITLSIDVDISKELNTRIKEKSKLKWFILNNCFRNNNRRINHVTAVNSIIKKSVAEQHFEDI